MIRTTDPDKMKKEISKLSATGGGDHPEMCLSGLQVLKLHDIVRPKQGCLLIEEKKSRNLYS